MNKLINFVNWIQLYFKGGEEMMAMFFAQRVILEKTAYKDVPSTLKPLVKEILEESGLGFLAVEE